jgi:hypothetical protein
MKLSFVLAVAVAAFVLTAPALARPHHSHHARWHHLSLEQKRVVVVKTVARERAPLRWWLRSHSRLPASSSGGLVYCASVGAHLPGEICVHAFRMVSALHVLARIDARLATAEQDAAWASIPASLHDAFACIHRYEGAWTSNTGNGYYGGLQMDLSFQASYGGEYLRRWGTADNWPVWAQVKAAAIAYQSGRGFYPWPNTARACGLI